MIALVDCRNNANIIHYGSAKGKRIARCVMAAEVLGLLYRYDNAYVAAHMLSEIFGRQIPIDIFIDSRTLFNVVAKNGSTTEKRIQIDVHALRESHKKNELRYIAWIPGAKNVADGLTKGIVKDNHPLWKMLIENRLDLNSQEWVQSGVMTKK